MATVYLTPNGDVYIGPWRTTSGGSSNLYDEVNDWFSNTEYVRLAENESDNLIFDLDMPVSDIGNVTQVDYEMYIRNEIDAVSTTSTLSAQLVDSTNNPITTSPSDFTLTDAEASFTLRTLSTTSLSGTLNQSRMSGARLKISGFADSSPGTTYLKISAIRVKLTYSVSSGGGHIYSSAVANSNKILCPG